MVDRVRDLARPLRPGAARGEQQELLVARVLEHVANVGRDVDEVVGPHVVGLVPEPDAAAS